MIRPEASLEDLERSSEHRLGFVQPISGLKQQREDVEAMGNIWMVGPQSGLADLKRPAGQRLGFSKPVGALQQSSTLSRSLDPARAASPERRVTLFSAETHNAARYRSR